MEGQNSKKPKNNTNTSKGSVEPIPNLFSFGDPESVTTYREDSESNLVANGRISVSSISSNSSFDGFFKSNHQLLPNPRSPKEPNEGPYPQFYKNSSKMHVSNEAWRRLGESAKACPKLTSQFSDVTIESFVPDIMPNTQSPPVQVMERSGSFDPDRIPASVFSSGPSNSVDWSAASNESLFSIQIGNDSFSRDHALRVSGELLNSGEIPKSGELFEPGGLYLSQEFYMPDELIRHGEKAHNDDKGVELNENVDVHYQTKSGSSVEDYSRPSSANGYSDGSEISTLPLAFPRNKKPSHSSCNCWPCCCFRSCCSCKWFRWLCCCNFCDWKWPSFHFKCPNLSCCCKCPTLSCCCKSPTLSCCCKCPSSWWKYFTCNKCKQ